MCIYIIWMYTYYSQFSGLLFICTYLFCILKLILSMNVLFSVVLLKINLLLLLLYSFNRLDLLSVTLVVFVSRFIVLLHYRPLSHFSVSLCIYGCFCLVFLGTYSFGCCRTTFILEWTQLVCTPALGVYLRDTHSLTQSGCPRHVGRNYVPLIGVAQWNVDLRYYVISSPIVIQILWCHLIMCTVGSICIILEFTNKTFL